MRSRPIDSDSAHGAESSTDHRPDPTQAWAEALRRFDRELQRRGAAERTRRAYGADAGALAGWAAAQGLKPEDVGYPILRRWAARLSQGGAAPRTLARKLASARAFFRVLVEHGELRANPADLMASPKLPERLPATLKAAEVAKLLDRIPATTPLELRDRALFEVAYGCGLRAEELVNLDVASVEFDAEQLRVLGKGSKTRFVPAGEPALRSVARYLERGRDRRCRAPRRSPRCSSPRPAAASRRQTSDAACGCGRATRRPRERCTRTRCGTPTRPISSRAERICGRSRSCSATAASPQPRSTLG